MGGRRPRARARGLLSPLRAAVAGCLLLVPVELGWVAPLRRAWGFNLWQYLPPPAAWGAAAAIALLCLPGVREHALRALAALCSRGAGRDARLLVAAPPVFWLLREREFFGDSRILMYGAASGARFRFPDLGSTWLFHLSRAASEALGLSDLAALQGLVCAAGGVAVFCTARLARELAPDRARAPAVAVLVLAGGLSRVFFGHVEVYAFVLACAAAYLWAACACLRGRCGIAAPAALLGVGGWLHPSFAFLLPSLVWLAWRAPGAGARWARLGLAGALAAAPLAGFLAAMAAAGHRADLEAALGSALAIAGARPAGGVGRYFVRPWGAEPVSGTDFALFSPRQLKYLANSFFVLAPAALPVLAGFGVAARRRFGATPEARLLCAASAGTLLYSLALRPVWGPYDWDLFSLTALCLACLAAHLLAHALSPPRFVHVALVLGAASLLFVGAPLVAIGIAPRRAAGPFAEQVRALPGESGWEAFERQVAPWL